MLSYWGSVLFRKSIRWGRYVAISIEPSNRCNLSCLECPTGTRSLTREKGEFSMEAYRKILNEKAKDLLYLNFYFQGEPFLNKDITEMINLASNEKIYTSVSTNAHQIDEELARKIVKSGLNRLIISIDGVSQEVYEKYRVGGELAKVIQATQNVINEKKRLSTNFPKIVFQFLVFRHNEHQIEDVRQLGKEMGVDKVEIKTAQIYNYRQNTEDIPSIDKYSRYKKDKNGIYQIKNKMPNRCWRMWHSAVITQDLNVLPCCYDKDATYKLGNLQELSISEIEQAKEYTAFRQQIIQNRAAIEICQNCSENLS
jgi:radical SAM protein with 4Fe4S-binding SPASM domain